MNMKTLLILICCSLLFVPSPINAHGNNQPALTDGSHLAEAMDITSSVLVNASISGHANATGVFSNLGSISPKQGATFTMLSLGIVGTSSPEPGTSGADEVTLTLTLAVPPGHNLLSFPYNFLSAEWPEKVGQSTYDIFTVSVTDSQGTREIVRASVNSDDFHPVSLSNAEGSGFDIFTEGPDGLPDAGLTGYRLINTPIATDDETITLTFTIKDGGDKTLDSVVILDGLTTSFLEVVDPNPIFLADGQIINEPETLAQGGQLRDGAVADGVTRVLLRSEVAGNGTVELCLAEANAPADGGLALLGQTGRVTCVVAPVIETTQGFRAFATYQVPDEFNRGGDEDLGERFIKFKAIFTPTAGQVVESEIPFRLVRPPLMGLHGLGSSAGTWAIPLMFEADPRFKITLGDYRDTNDSHFAQNLLVPGRSIREAIIRLLLEHIAATQADCFAHSMGGILCRNHAGRDDYKNNENFNEGDINKCMTLDTPHLGSPLANVLIDAHNNAGILEPALEALVEAALGVSITGGAIEDLAVGSAAINEISQTPVPCHALVGIILDVPVSIEVLFELIEIITGLSFDDIFQGLESDGVVTRPSQEGGLPSSATKVFQGVFHSAPPKSLDYSNHLIELFNSSADSSLFAVFPPPASLPISTNPSPLQTPSSIMATQTSSTGGLVITSPGSGTQVSPGSSIVVVVEPELGVIVDKVLVVGMHPGVGELDKQPPFEITLTIPAEAEGDFTIFALARDSNGNRFISEGVVLQVVGGQLSAQATLNSITITTQDPILFGPGDNRNLAVLGKFDDDSIEDLTLDDNTQYLTSDPSIMTVSSEGKVTANGPGKATVIVRNGSAEDSTSVLVFVDNQAPTANAGPNQNGLGSEQITLDGNASTDPDSGPNSLSFEWLQIGGPQVALTGATTATPTFTPVQGGTYIFSLVVRDGQTDSIPDSVTITIPYQIHLPVILSEG